MDITRGKESSEITRFLTFTEEQYKASYLETLQTDIGSAQPRAGCVVGEQPFTSLVLSISDQERCLHRAQKIQRFCSDCRQDGFVYEI